MDAIEEKGATHLYAKSTTLHRRDSPLERMLTGPLPPATCTVPQRPQEHPAGAHYLPLPGQGSGRQALILWYSEPQELVRWLCGWLASVFWMNGLSNCKKKTRGYW